MSTLVCANRRVCVRLGSPQLRSRMQTRLEAATTIDRAHAPRSKVEVVLSSHGELGDLLGKALVERNALRYGCAVQIFCVAQRLRLHKAVCSKSCTCLLVVDGLTA